LSLEEDRIDALGSRAIAYREPYTQDIIRPMVAFQVY
jgi:hypothetical protein